MAGGMLEGRVGLVTGAAGGFGRHWCRMLLDEGARVALLDVDEDGLNGFADELRAEQRGHLILPQLVDIADHRACEAAVARTVETFGGLHVLINNGALGMGLIRDDHMHNLVTIDEIAPEQWDRMVQVNLSGAWYLTRAAAPHMKAAGWGRIMTVTTSFFTMMRGRFHPYGPSKAALESMTAGHAREFEGTGITVNIVVPGGPADTPMVPEDAGFDRSALVKPSAMTLPGRFLCSPAGDAVTGMRYVAGLWDPDLPADEARKAAEAPIGWPDLAQAPVWPGGKPAE